MTNNAGGEPGARPQATSSPFAIGTPGKPGAAMQRSPMALVKPEGTSFFDAKMSQPGRDKLDIATARNALIKDFLTAHENPKWHIEKPLQWLLQVDGDAVLHPLTLARLQSWNRACVGALCVTRYRPYQPVVYRGQATGWPYRDRLQRLSRPVKKLIPKLWMRSYYIQWQEVTDWCKAHPQIANPGGPALLDPPPTDSLHEVDWTGSHCFLCHRSVFEKVKEPWFELAPKIKYGSGSDRLFFEKVKAAGVHVYVDFSVVAGHAAEMVLGMADFLAYQSISTYVETKPDRKEGRDGDSVFCGDDWSQRQPKPGTDTEPASAGGRLARALAVVDRMGL